MLVESDNVSKRSAKVKLLSNCLNIIYRISVSIKSEELFSTSVFDK